MLPAFLLLLLLPLAGCYAVKKQQVARVVVAPHVLDASVDQLLAGVAKQYTAIQSLTASLEVTATEGDEHTGEVKEFPAFSGYLFLRKPADLRLQLRVPVIMSLALDMVSNGKTFRMYIPPKNLAYLGSDATKDVGKPGFENVRPKIIRDALLIPPVEPGEYVDVTKGSRLLESDSRRGANTEKVGAGASRKDLRRESIEEPDYHLNIVRIQQGQVLETVRVIRISRITLLPYEQEIYENGDVVTRVEYSNYQKFGDVSFPMSILITRPIDQYKVKLELSKLTLNPELGEDTFEVKIPAEGVKINQLP